MMNDLPKSAQQCSCSLVAAKDMHKKTVPGYDFILL